MKMKIVADDKIPFLKGVLEKYADMVYLPGKDITGKIIRDADALLIRTRTKCNDELLEGTRVRFIGTATIGYDHIDAGFCASNNIHWTSAPGCNSSSVNQYVVSALLTLTKELDFNPAGKTIGVVGVGNVGSKVARSAAILGMNVLLNDPPRSRVEGNGNFVPLTEIIDNADIITVHVPLNLAGDDRTWHLFSRENFRRMKPGSWLINSSRGEVVDTASMKKELSAGKIRTVLDVWENEPDIDPDLLSMSFISTPHIAGYSTDGKVNGTSMIVRELGRFFNLPVKDWFPVNVPEPERPVINIDCRGKEDNRIIMEAVLHSYNIRNDDEKLRYNPADFEKLRGDYPLRREFPSYSINLGNCSSVDIGKKLRSLGFRLISD